MEPRQKVIGISFVILILGMLLPSLFPSLPGMAFLSSNSLGLALFMVAALALIRLNGKSVLEIPQVMATNFNWGAYFIIVAAILLGSVLTSDNTGVSAFLSVVLSPIFQGMSPMVFTVLLDGDGGSLNQPLQQPGNRYDSAAGYRYILYTDRSQPGTDRNAVNHLCSVIGGYYTGSIPVRGDSAQQQGMGSDQYVYQYTIPFVILELIIVLVVGVPVSKSVNVSLERSYVSWHSMM